MEERYAGLSLVFDGSESLRKEIDDAIKQVCKETGLEPTVFDNADTDKAHHEAFYIEFHDEVQREAGAFFTRVLKLLGIDHCANDVIA
jgi:precorrin-6x reductase